MARVQMPWSFRLGSYDKNDLQIPSCKQDHSWQVALVHLDYIERAIMNVSLSRCLHPLHSDSTHARKPVCSEPSH